MLLLIAGTGAKMYDVVMDEYVSSCATGCDLWTAHNASLWAAGSPPSGAGNACAASR